MSVAELEQNISELVKNTGLKHIAIIMDGNRRWAKERHLPSAMGHQKGVSALKNTLKACHSFGVKYLTVYAFSTENWNRPQEEVNFLMGLLANTIKNELLELDENDVKIKFIGNISALNSDLQAILKDSEEKTKDNNGVNLQIAFNYGARMEITNACKQIAEDVKNGKINPSDITENTVSEKLYTSNLPEPDLLIRTGGEKRISNYLLWQLAYSEIYVTDIYWPEFDKNALADAITEYSNRTRRFGK
ncbi:MAG: isoprenyl transferase [Candidatus Gastranaerophilales bacterium]|nr:isoprenyl transferase [Candidatus Gastranaerophilales bacterium]